MQDYIEEQVTTPIGNIISFMGTKAPKGHLICDGSLYDVQDYPEFVEYLKEQFGNIYYFGGSGDKFAVPDLRGEFLRCTGSNSHTYGGAGAAVGNHQAPTLYPRISVQGNSFFMYRDTSKFSGDWCDDAGNIKSYDSSHSATASTVRYGNIGSINNQSSAQPVYYSIRPTNTSVKMCIKVKYYT